MMTTPSSKAKMSGFTLVISTLIVLAMAIYTLGYFWAGKFRQMETGGRLMYFRTFDHEWEPYLFLPAELIEARWRKAHGQEFYY